MFLKSFEIPSEDFKLARYCLFFRLLSEDHAKVNNERFKNTTPSFLVRKEGERNQANFISPLSRKHISGLLGGKKRKEKNMLMVTLSVLKQIRRAFLGEEKKWKICKMPLRGIFDSLLSLEKGIAVLVGE